MRHFLEEFKKFAVRGNVVDLAVAVVIGAAFGKIVSSLVSNIVMPLVGILIGGVSFKELAFTFSGAEVIYGVFIQSVVDFIIISFAIFVVVKIMNKLQERDDEEKKEQKKKNLLRRSFFFARFAILLRKSRYFYRILVARSSEVTISRT